jgi:hypothetical protein
MTEVPKHIEVIEVMARGIYDAFPMRQSIGDGPWTVVKWEDAGSGLQEHLIAVATAAHAALVEAGFVVIDMQECQGKESALGTEFLKQLYDGIVTDGPAISFQTLEGKTPDINGRITAFGIGTTILSTLRAMIEAP